MPSIYSVNRYFVLVDYENLHNFDIDTTLSNIYSTYRQDHHGGRSADPIRRCSWGKSFGTSPYSTLKTKPVAGCLQVICRYYAGVLLIGSHGIVSHPHSHFFSLLHSISAIRIIEDGVTDGRTDRRKNRPSYMHKGIQKSKKISYHPLVFVRSNCPMRSRTR